MNFHVFFYSVVSIFNKVTILMACNELNPHVLYKLSSRNVFTFIKLEVTLNNKLVVGFSIGIRILYVATFPYAHQLHLSLIYELLFPIRIGREV